MQIADIKMPKKVNFANLAHFIWFLLPSHWTDAWLNCAK